MMCVERSGAKVKKGREGKRREEKGREGKEGTRCRSEIRKEETKKAREKVVLCSRDENVGKGGVD